MECCYIKYFLIKIKIFLYIYIYTELYKINNLQFFSCFLCAQFLFVWFILHFIRLYLSLTVFSILEERNGDEVSGNRSSPHGIKKILPIINFTFSIFRNPLKHVISRQQLNNVTARNLHFPQACLHNSMLMIRL